MEQYLEKIKANQITEIDLNTGDCGEIEPNDLITDVEIVTLAEALKYNSSLTSLNLSGNEIGIEGSQVLSEALKVNSPLVVLNLECNQMSDTGAQYLSEALKDNSSLTTLNLGVNQITNTGLQMLSEMLKKNTSLNSLYINNNLIDSMGAQALSKTLKENSTLTYLNLEWNAIAIGMETLSEALTVNKTLTTLNLSHIRIGYAVMALSKALKKNSSLTTLSVSGNKIRTDREQTIYESLQINKDQIKNSRNQTLLALAILLRHANSIQSQLPFELWEIIIKKLDFPSVHKGYRASDLIVDFLKHKNVFNEFNQRLQSQRSFRLLETHGTKLGESRFSFLVLYKRKLTPDIDAQPDDQPMLKKVKYN